MQIDELQSVRRDVKKRMERAVDYFRTNNLHASEHQIEEAALELYTLNSKMKEYARRQDELELIELAKRTYGNQS